MNWLYDNFISDFLVIVIQWIVRFIGEYSIAIILSMLLVRFVLLPLEALYPEGRAWGFDFSADILRVDRSGVRRL